MRGWEWWIFGVTWEPCNHLFCRRRMNLVDRIWYGVGVHRLHLWIKRSNIVKSHVVAYSRRSR